MKSLLMLCLLLVLIIHSSCMPERSWWLQPPRDNDALFVVGAASAKTLDQGRTQAIKNVAAQVAEYLDGSIKVTGNITQTEVERRIFESLTFSTGAVPVKGGLVLKWHEKEDTTGGFHLYVLVRYPYDEIEKVRKYLSNERANRVARIRFLNSLEMAIVSGNNQIIPIGKPFEPLVVRVTSATIIGKKIPAKGIPVRFRWEDDTEGVLVKTDAGGEAKSENRQIRSSFPSIGIHQVVADITGLESKINQEVRFALTVIPRPNPPSVHVVIEASTMGVNLSNALRNALREAGFTMVTDGPSNLFATGTATTRPGSENMGGVISSYATARVSVINTASGHVIAESLIDAVGFGNATTSADIAAIQEAGRQASLEIVRQLLSVDVGRDDNGGH